MRRDNKKMTLLVVDDDDDLLAEDSYFTYRPLSNLPTPPPSSREPCAPQSAQTTLDDGEPLQPKFRGPAIHLVNLIPASASLATASVPLVQALLSRASLTLETVALAVCILDSLGAEFARTWRLSCPLQCDPASKRHTLPPTLLMDRHPRQLHIDSVNPELIVLSALVIAAKFMDDLQESTHYYCASWGRDMWPANQLNATERCIMESLGYRIMPLCNESCLADAMVDMQLAARQHDWHPPQPSPPESVAAGPTGDEFVPSHGRSKTVVTVGLDVPPTPLESQTSRSSTPKAE